MIPVPQQFVRLVLVLHDDFHPPFFGKTAGVVIAVVIVSAPLCRPLGLRLLRLLLHLPLLLLGLLPHGLEVLRARCSRLLQHVGQFLLHLLYIHTVALVREEPIVEIVEVLVELCSVREGFPVRAVLRPPHLQHVRLDPVPRLGSTGHFGVQGGHDFLGLGEGRSARIPFVIGIGGGVGVGIVRSSSSARDELPSRRVVSQRRGP
mmetsp:Transcript_33455/g.99656  ORF Transcript_33455/g.99656 Transcript_33455/m.99656 type:complete len:205 (-) Transcript_33455:1584-2198(-)